jgi:hypothetical protein
VGTDNHLTAFVASDILQCVSLPTAPGILQLSRMKALVLPSSAPDAIMQCGSLPTTPTSLQLSRMKVLVLPSSAPEAKSDARTSVGDRDAAKNALQQEL